MMSYNALKQHLKHFYSFTGLTVNEFDKLVSQIYDDWFEQRIERLNKNNPHRQRKIGGGRKNKLATLEDQLLLCLVWTRVYPSYLLLEYLFGLDESNVYRTIQQVLPVLQSKFVLSPIKGHPGRKITTLEQLRKLIPDLDEVLVDATEQKIPRPEKKRKRNKYHSGKKKAFTAKTQIATNKRGLIIHLSDTSPGRKHDYKVFKESDLSSVIPQNSKTYADSGYQGINKDFPYLNARVPFKRSKNHKELTRSEKIFNTKQRKIRITVEHSIGRMKKYQVLTQTYRHCLQNYNSVIRFIANIANFQMLERLPAV